MAAPSKPPKMMSSRLSGMKFMQRNLGSPTTPSTPTEPPFKKQRLSSGSSVRSPATPVETPDDQKRTAVTEREAFSKGENKWYLSYKPPQTPIAEPPFRIVSAGFASLDAVDQVEAQSREDEGDDKEARQSQMAGRKNFGNFSRKEKKQKDSDTATASDPGTEQEEREEDGEIEDDPTGVKALLAQGQKEATERARAERKAKKQTEDAELVKLAAQRRTKERNLNKMTSISSGGAKATGGRQSHTFKEMVCHNCGQNGHPKKACPN